jgi:aromatic-L-amino-acid decarboxylase
MTEPVTSRSIDMEVAEFREHGRAVLERMAAYLERPEAHPVVPAVLPGEVARGLPAEAPARGESMDAILADFDRIIMPGTTHWNHPSFFAYFASSGSAPGILAEMLAATLNVNAMLWRTGPSATELEDVTLGWLRRLIGLPDGFDGTITDTGSSSTLYALAAARELAGDLRIREEGLAGRPDVPRLAVYRSEEAHSSIDKAAITLGLGLSGVRAVATDASFRMDAAALERAIAEDRAHGVRPLAVVATVGTTGVTAVDPVPAIAAICEREGLWLHVDAAYGGSAAVIPEMRHVLAGCERAHSLVVNPHKWLFTPIDCSALYTRRPDLLRRAFSVVPEYLTTPHGDDVKNLMDYGISLGRRFRALKLWFVLRWFGAEGLAERLREHLRLAAEFAGWVDAAPEFERLAPVPFSVVAFRHAPRALAGDEAALDAHNAGLLERVNATGEVYLSHTKVRGRYAIRLAVGNIRTERRHVQRAWELIKNAAESPLRA